MPEDTFCMATENCISKYRRKFVEISNLLSRLCKQVRSKKIIKVSIKYWLKTLKPCDMYLFLCIFIIKRQFAFKCQSLFSGKNYNNISKCRLLKFLPRVQRVKAVMIMNSPWSTMAGIVIDMVLTTTLVSTRITATFIMVHLTVTS